MLVKSQKATVYVGLSGGVDSSVTAFLLKEAGFKVVGVYLRRIGDPNNPHCPEAQDIEYARKAAQHLGISFRVWDLRQEYKEAVLSYFIKEYKAGRTPNPDVLCNNLFKFGVFLQKALQIGADFVATGHYALVSAAHGVWSINADIPQVWAGIDSRKDQSYFLHRLTPEQINRAIMPLGWLKKQEVRGIAKLVGLPTAAKKDSQGICFLGDVDITEFLKQYIEPKKGPIIDIESGKKVGIHSGVWFYTIGQRSGLGIGGAGTPYYVVRKDIQNNTLFVAKGRDNKYLSVTAFGIEDLYIVSSHITSPFRAAAVIRYHGTPVYSVIKKNIVVAKQARFWAVAPGQFVVFYDPSYLEVYNKQKKYANIADPSEIVTKLLSDKWREFVKERHVLSAPILGGAVISKPIISPTAKDVEQERK